MNYSWDTDWSDDTLLDDYGDPVDDDFWYDEDDYDEDDWGDDPDEQPIMPITLSLLRTMLEDDSKYFVDDDGPTGTRGPDDSGLEGVQDDAYGPNSDVRWWHDDAPAHLTPPDDDEAES